MRFHLTSASAIIALIAVTLAAQQPAATQEKGKRNNKGGGEETERGRAQARSMVITKFGIVATSQTLASQAGAKILEAGGNAIDAAIAANAVLGLVEPESDGIGGDLFAIYYDAKTKKLYGLNASGWAPSGLTVEYLKARNITRMPNNGMFSISVPGAVAGWEALRGRFGSLPYSTLLAPAIYYAEQGFPVTEIIQGSWKGSENKLSNTQYAKETYLPGGKAPEVGEMFKNPGLAASLKRIAAANGPNGFYKGATAEAILRLSKENDGTFTASDLADFKPEWIEPVSTTYHGWTISELPPNSSGVAVLEMLNIMETFPLASYGHNSTKALHVMIEAKKLAYNDLLKYIGDPEFAKLPTAELMSKPFAEKRAAAIDPMKATCMVVPGALTSMATKPAGDTIYMTVADKDGNMVSFIQSIYGIFGSGLVAPGTGFIMQNRAGLFTLEDGHPNRLAPHKRPLHTLIPGFMSKGDIRIPFGIMGGWNQQQAHAQFVSNIVDHNMNLQMAMEAARFTKGSFDGCDVQLESRIPKEVRDELTKMGHDVRDAGPYSGSMGGGQAVMRNAAGVNFGASDPRKDGAAIPEMPPGVVKMK
ncbi:MAG: gamma-glutamyltransferase [Bryobacteraceae bacterium]